MGWARHRSASYAQPEQAAYGKAVVKRMDADHKAGIGPGEKMEELERGEISRKKATWKERAWQKL